MANDTTVSAGGGTLVGEIAKLVREQHQFQIVALSDPDTEGQPDAFVAVVPDGKKLVSIKPFLDEHLALPRRRVGTAKMRDEDSFIEHVNRFKSQESAIFALPDRAKPSFTAVLDYHPETEDVNDAAWGQHRTLYECPLSDEWKVWDKINGQPMSQVDFAAFLEDRLTDVLDTSPEGDGDLAAFAKLVGGFYASPSVLVGLSRGLQVNVQSVVKNAITLATGEIDIIYSEQHSDGTGAPLKVANLFVIAIPVFYAGPLYRIPVRLRYRRNGGSLTWSCHLVRADRVFDDAFANAREAITAGTELPVFTGVAELAPVVTP